jgi:hypothetical protein
MTNIARHYLREWRAKRGLDREELAAMVGTSASMIADFEIGERHMKLDMQADGGAPRHPEAIFLAAHARPREV